MLKFGIGVIIFFVCNLTYGQNSIDHEFVGNIQLIDKSIISYQLAFTEHADGSIAGKSITDFAGPHRTETNIIGKIDREAKTITFNEKENVTTKSDAASADFCYVHLYNAKIKLKGDKNIIQGHFYSRYKGGEKCVEGDIYLVSDDFLFNKIKSFSKKKIVPKDKREMLSDMVSTSQSNIDNAILEENDQLVVNAFDGNIMIRIWDAEHIDGDRISVYKDDKIILNDYKIKRAMKQLLVPIEKDSTIIRFEATNEGRIPPNSANVSVNNNKIDVPIKMKLNKGKVATLLVLKNDE